MSIQIQTETYEQQQELLEFSKVLGGEVTPGMQGSFASKHYGVFLLFSNNKSPSAHSSKYLMDTKMDTFSDLPLLDICNWGNSL